MIFTKNCFTFSLILILGFALTNTQAEVREGEAAGIFHTFVSAEDFADPANAGIEDTANMWSLPIVYGSYGGVAHIDFQTDLAGWLVLHLFNDGGDHNAATPAFNDNDDYGFIDINMFSMKASANLKEMDLGPLPILVGGQCGGGYMGVDACSNGSGTHFEKDSYFSYGWNAGTGFEIGEQFFQSLFLFDWIYSDNETGTRWGVEVEYFPFPTSSIFQFSRVKVFTKSTSLDYNLSNVEEDCVYTNFQFGLGCIFNIPMPDIF